MYTRNTPLKGKTIGDAKAIAEGLIARGAKRPAWVHIYVSSLFADASVAGLAGHVLLGQWHLETGGGTSDAWETYGNPAGIGITSNAERGWFTFQTPEQAARAHVVHMSLYVNGTTLPEPFKSSDDPRWDAAVADGRAGSAECLADLSGEWAVDRQYAELIASRINELTDAGIIPAQEATPVVAAARIVLVAGHNSIGDGGDPVERGLTPKLATAYKAAFEKAGFPVTYVNPTKPAGGLTQLSLNADKAIADAPEGLVFLFDLHFNTRKSVVHAIVPHNRTTDGRAQLASFFVQGRVADDIADNNPLDCKIASNIAVAIAEANNLTPRSNATGYGRGVMLENETRVGLPVSQGGLGSRLAIMGATAGHRLKAVRITIEHGGTDDASKPDFFNKCANAAVSVVKSHLGNSQPVPNPNPAPETPPTGDTGTPDVQVWAFGSADGYSFDPTGPVTKLWQARGTEVGRYPRLTDVLEVGTTRYFAFADGWIVQAEQGKAPTTYKA